MTAGGVIAVAARRRLADVRFPQDVSQQVVTQRHTGAAVERRRVETIFGVVAEGLVQVAAPVPALEQVARRVPAIREILGGCAAARARPAVLDQSRQRTESRHDPDGGAKGLVDYVARSVGCPESPERSARRRPIHDPHRLALLVLITDLQPEAGGAGRVSQRLELPGGIVGVAELVHRVRADPSRSQPRQRVIDIALGVAGARNGSESAYVPGRPGRAPGPPRHALRFHATERPAQQVVGNGRRLRLGIGPRHDLAQRVGEDRPGAQVHVELAGLHSADVVGDLAGGVAESVVDPEQLAECTVLVARRPPQRIGHADQVAPGSPAPRGLVAQAIGPRDGERIVVVAERAFDRSTRGSE